MCIMAGQGGVWQAAGSEPLFLMQRMESQRSRPKQAEGLVEEGEKEELLPHRPRAACAAPTRGSGTQGTVEAARDG